MNGAVEVTVWTVDGETESATHGWRTDHGVALARKDDGRTVRIDEIPIHRIDRTVFHFE